MSINNSFKKIKSTIYKICYGKISYFRYLGGQIGSGCRLIGKVDFGSEPYLIKIGNSVSITSSSFVNHDGGVWVFRNEHPDIDVIKPIIIGNNVFIGSGCTILPGVTIGDNVVVGAGSIVTRNIPNNSVYAGVPAKLIKSIADYKQSAITSNTHTKGSNSKREILLEMYKSQLSNHLKK